MVILRHPLFRMAFLLMACISLLTGRCANAAGPTRVLIDELISSLHFSLFISECYNIFSKLWSISSNFLYSCGIFNESKYKCKISLSQNNMSAVPI